ncbi:MAG: DUF3037 domain-containing protein [Rhodothermales bacterium]
MHNQCLYDYAIIRVIPRVEREEFVNAGVILSCKKSDYLGVRIELDENRLLALNPTADLKTINKHLTAITRICNDGEGPIGQLTRRERFHWLVAPRSTMIQTSAVHAGYCSDTVLELERLVDTMVRTPKPVH